MELRKEYITDLQSAKSLSDILEDLKKPIPARLIRKKKTPKFTVDYVHHTTIRDLLDFYAPGWESEKHLYEACGKLYVRIRLTIHGADGSITRDGIGNEDAEEDIKYGDASSNADAQALRRAAMEFGLGRALWKPKN